MYTLSDTARQEDQTVKVDVWDLLLDDANVEKMHGHGISVRRAFEVVAGAARVLRNSAEGGAPWLLVGPDSGGAFVTLPIDSTAEHGLWRPRTAYPSKASDIARYHAQRSRER